MKVYVDKEHYVVPAPQENAISYLHCLHWKPNISSPHSLPWVQPRETERSDFPFPLLPTFHCTRWTTLRKGCIDPVMGVDASVSVNSGSPWSLPSLRRYA